MSDFEERALQSAIAQLARAAKRQSWREGIALEAKLHTTIINFQATSVLPGELHIYFGDQECAHVASLAALALADGELDVARRIFALLPSWVRHGVTWRCLAKVHVVRRSYQGFELQPSF